MIYNLVQNLCEPLVKNIGGVADTGGKVPITYLTQWRMMGNSTVHTDEYLTQWKVSGNSQVQQYLTQWKVEGNSVVDNNTILSCGDLGQDNKYHVKISDGVNVYDIPLTEPLRKVNNVADSIEFVNGVATVTRNIASTKWNELTVIKDNQVSTYDRFRTDSLRSVILLPESTASSRTDKCLSADFVQNTTPINKGTDVDQCMAAYNTGSLYIRDTSVSDATEFQAKYGTHELLYRLATATTETIQAPQISVSPTYTSANDVAYSSFTYANPLIYSCGDYSDVDGKYHVKISNGVTIYDIALDEPLRKVNDIADTIEFVNGSAVLTRNLAKAILSDLTWFASANKNTGKYKYSVYSLLGIIKLAKDNTTPGDILCNIYDTTTANGAYATNLEGIAVESVQGSVYLYDANYDQESDLDAFLEHIQGAEMVYALATPITETIQVSPFPISPTDTYTSANDTPYSAFEYKKNVEIWSCGEYSAVDGKYHILVQPLGGSIADIALDEPLRKWDNDYIDSIDYSNGVATLTRKVGKITVVPDNITLGTYGSYDIAPIPSDILYETASYIRTKNNLYEDVSNDDRGVSTNPPPRMYLASAIHVRGTTVQQQGGSVDDYIQELKDFYNNGGTLDILYKLATPTTEIIQVPQIEDAESYTCVISQGAKAVSWSSFETE